MNNECPYCHEQAMDASSKLVKRPFTCQHCGGEVRLNLVYSSLLALVYLAVVVSVLLDGIDGGAMAWVALATAAFIGACLFMPLEAKGGARQE